jgi:hypothetical protein
MLGGAAAHGTSMAGVDWADSGSAGQLAGNENSDMDRGVWDDPEIPALLGMQHWITRKFTRHKHTPAK